MFTKKLLLSLLIIFSLVVIPTSTSLASNQIGIQSSSPGHGLSGIISLNNLVSVQAIIGSELTIRGRYIFDKNYNWRTYGYTAFSSSGPKNNLKTGIGAGLDYDWQALDNSLPPLSTNLELGFEFSDSDFQPVFGLGTHYHF